MARRPQGSGDEEGPTGTLTQDRAGRAEREMGQLSLAVPAVCFPPRAPRPLSAVSLPPGGGRTKVTRGGPACGLGAGAGAGVAVGGAVWFSAVWEDPRVRSRAPGSARCSRGGALPPRTAQTPQDLPARKGASLPLYE